MNTRLLKYMPLVLGLVLGTSIAAHGMIFRKAPEIDPSFMVSALTLLAGTLAITHIRRKKK